MGRLTIAAMIIAAAALTGCRGQGLMWKDVDRAVAVMHPTEGNAANGVVHFIQQSDGVLIAVDIRDLEPNSTHAFHAHQFGDCSALDASSAGGHYNPQGYPHALPPTMPRHAGDFGNIVADAKGRAQVQLKVSNITVAGMYNPVVGRAVILHAKADTGMGESGEAGARIASGVIGIANPSIQP